MAKCGRWRAPAAIEAMEWGRRVMWALAKGEEEEVAPGQTLITTFIPIEAGPEPPLPPADRAARKAASWFWCLMQDLVAVQEVPEGWGGLTPDHPFIGVVRLEGNKRHLRLNQPG